MMNQSDLHVYNDSFDKANHFEWIFRQVQNMWQLFFEFLKNCRNYEDIVTKSWISKNATTICSGKIGFLNRDISSFHLMYNTACYFLVQGRRELFRNICSTIYLMTKVTSHNIYQSCIYFLGFSEMHTMIGQPHTVHIILCLMLLEVHWLLNTRRKLFCKGNFISFVTFRKDSPVSKNCFKII